MGANKGFTAEGKAPTFLGDSTMGFSYKEADDLKPVLFRGYAIIRSGAVFYADVAIGDDFQSGHNALIREKTTIGKVVTVGTNVVIDGNCSIGDFVKIETGVYISTHVTIGSHVFIGPNAVFTNDRYPLRQRSEYEPLGVTVKDNVTIGANVTLCPGITIGSYSFIAAGTTVTKDVPDRSLVVGSRGEVRPLPEALDEGNMALSWAKYYD